MTKTILILIIAAAFVAGTLTTATIVNAQGDTIQACIDKKGKVRIVDSPADCKNNETPLEWNIQGPAGQGITFIKKTVPNQSCILQGNALVGWCPDGTKKLFIIRDSALISAKAVILSLQQNNIANPPVCNIVLDGAGFAQMIIGCNPAPPNLALSKLVYIIQK